jgi:hypothetical protein
MIGRPRAAISLAAGVINSPPTFTSRTARSNSAEMAETQPCFLVDRISRGGSQLSAFVSL